jgi:hypothetical protein
MAFAGVVLVALLVTRIQGNPTPPDWIQNIVGESWITLVVGFIILVKTRRKHDTKASHLDTITVRTANGLSVALLTIIIVFTVVSFAVCVALWLSSK